MSETSHCLRALVPSSVPIALVGMLGCSPACPPQPPKTLPEQTVASPASSANHDQVAASPALARRPSSDIDIIIMPLPSQRRVRVKISTSMPIAKLSRWKAPGASAHSLLNVHARDREGAVPWRRVAGTGSHGVELVLSPRAGTVEVSYEVASSPRVELKQATVAQTPDTLEASGESLLLLPSALESQVFSARISYALEKFNPGRDPKVRGASSFGNGDVSVPKVRARELWRGTFLAGDMGWAAFDAKEGRDDAAWLGYTSFDPRPISADTAAFRTAAAQRLGPPSIRRASLLIVTNRSRERVFRSWRRARSVLLHVNPGQAWTSRLRIAVASEVLHDWIGGQLWIGPTDPARETEAAWFTDGVARHVATDLLFRFGLLTPQELLQEVHALESTTLTSEHRALDNQQLARLAKTSQSALTLLVARGALYARRVDALAGKGKNGSSKLVREIARWLLKARGTGGRLPLSAWATWLDRDVRPGEAKTFAASVMQGGSIEVPARALGPCFVPTTKTYVAYDLGFDLDRSWPRAVKSQQRTLKGVRKDGPAYRAGLREGDELVGMSLKGRSPDVPVTIKVRTDGVEKQVTYRPRGHRARGQGWRRNPAVPDSKCVPAP